MEYAQIDDNGIFLGYVDGKPGDVPGSFVPPEGAKVVIGGPTTNEPGKWVLVGEEWKELTLVDVKNIARQELKDYRKQIEYGGFMLNGQRWDSEQKDELRLNSAGKIFEAGLPEYPGWKIADGVYITLTPQLLQQATLAFMQHTGAAFALEAAKLAEIEALESSEAVLACLETEMKEGWPGAELEAEPEADSHA